MTSEQVDLYREILGGPRGQGPRAVLLAAVTVDTVARLSQTSR